MLIWYDLQFFSALLPLCMPFVATKQVWGYTMVSAHALKFYHANLSDISDHIIGECIQGVSYIEREKDGSIIVHIENSEKAEAIFRSLLTLCTKKISGFLETPNFYYKIPPPLRQSFLSWSLAFEGCVAHLLLSDRTIRSFVRGDWEYINARTGGIYLHPYTLLFYENHPKIAHPVSIKNISQRTYIEQKTAHYIRILFRRMYEAQTHMEGMAILSLVEERTGRSAHDITQDIATKSFQVCVPLYSSFFAGI
jgi:hypothetical protein